MVAFANEGDVEWLRENEIHILLNDLAGDMLKNRPGDVLGFVSQWCLVRKEGEKQLGRTPSSVNIGGSLIRRPSRGDLEKERAESIAERDASYDQEEGDPGQPPHPPAPPNASPPQQQIWGRPTPTELAERHPNPENDYVLLDCIGEGHYGKVYEAVTTNPTVLAALEDLGHEGCGEGKAVAVKKVPIDGDWVEQEIQNLIHCRGDYTATLLQSHYSREEDQLWIVMELLGTNMAMVAESAGPRAFTEPMIASVTQQVLLGLSAIHARNRVHLDIKPGNMILTHDRQRIKLADFGTMQIIGDDCIQLGDFAFMSPEVAYSSGKYQSQSDIWSVGITCLYFADGEAPLWKEKPELLTFIHRESCLRPALWDPSRYSKLFSDSLFACFMKAPHERPTASDLLESQWMNTFAPGELLLPASQYDRHQYRE